MWMECVHYEFMVGKNIKEIAKMNCFKALNVEIKIYIYSFNMKYHTTCPLQKEKQKSMDYYVDIAVICQTATLFFLVCFPSNWLCG
jgi:predicted RNA-binding protein associated with RNAse of E/G family